MGSFVLSVSLVAYSRLVMFSFGFQQAFHRGIERSDQVFFTKVCASFLFLKQLCLCLIGSPCTVLGSG